MFVKMYEKNEKPRNIFTAYQLEEVKVIKVGEENSETKIKLWIKASFPEKDVIEIVLNEDEMVKIANLLNENNRR